MSMGLRLATLPDAGAPLKLNEKGTVLRENFRGEYLGPSKT